MQPPDRIDAALKRVIDEVLSPYFKYFPSLAIVLPTCMAHSISNSSTTCAILHRNVRTPFRTSGALTRREFSDSMQRHAQSRQIS
eukprot:6247166-Pyramimonas_sp.AAC.1